jgi:hypothetical protein
MSELLHSPGESSEVGLPPQAKAAAHSRRVFLFKLSVLLNAAVGDGAGSADCGVFAWARAEKELRNRLLDYYWRSRCLSCRRDSARRLCKPGVAAGRRADSKGRMLG